MPNEDDRPVDAARQRASELRGQVTGLAEHLEQQMRALVDELRTVANPDAAEAQIESVTTDAAERVAAAIARATRAEQAQRQAEGDRADADAAAEEASDLAEALRGDLVAARQAHTDLDAELTRTREQAEAELLETQGMVEDLREQVAGVTERADRADRDQAEAQAREQAATAARVQAQEQAAVASARAQDAAERASDAESEAAGIREQLDRARVEHEELAGQLAQARANLAAAVAEGAAARADVDREREHGNQRVNDLRTNFEQQITQLREELTAARSEGHDERRRADRAEAKLNPET